MTVNQTKCKADDDLEASVWVNYMNQNEYNLRFTIQENEESINFLDLMLKGVVCDMKVEVELWRKPISRNSLRNAASCYPRLAIYAALKRRIY